MALYDDDDFYILNNYRDWVIRYKKRIKWTKTYMILCIFNTIIFTIVASQSETTWSIVMNTLSSISWLIIILITLKNLKILKNSLIDSEKNYYEELKRVDYTKYIKEQRTKKLSKIKKAIKKAI